MKVADIRALSLEDLKAKIVDEKAAYLKLKMSHGIAHMEDPLSIRKSRRNIARMLTVLKEKSTQQ